MSQIFTESAADLNGVLTLTGNSGGAVGPSTGNVNVVGIAGVTVTGNPGTNTLTIGVIGSAVSWNVIGASQIMNVDSGYFCTTGAALSLALPATSVVGNIIEISLDGSTSFVVTQGAGQQIRFGNLATTPGISGSLTSTQQGDSIKLVCSVANLKWNIVASMGNPIII